MDEYDHINNSNDDSFDRNILEIGLYQSGPVDSKIRGNPCKPVAMINDIPAIEELEDGEILGEPVFNSTMISNPVSTVPVPEPSPVEQTNTSYQLNSEELATRLNHTPVEHTVNLTVRDHGSGIPLHTKNCDCSESESGPCVSWNGFTGNVKIVTQTVLLNKGILSVNKKKVQKLQEDIFQQQLKFEKTEDSNLEASAKNKKLEDTFKSLQSQLQEHKKTVNDLTLKHKNLVEDHETCKRMMEEATRFEICATGGAEQIATALQNAYDDQLAFSKLQKNEINEVTKKINKFTNERKSFLKLTEERMTKFNDKAEHGIEKLVKAHERTISIQQRNQGEISELENELEEAYEENEQLLEELGCEPDEVAEWDSQEFKNNVSKLEVTSRALQTKVRELATVNRELVEQNLNLSVLTGNSSSAVGIPNRRSSAIRKKFKSRNVSFSGYEAAKTEKHPILNKTC